MPYIPKIRPRKLTLSEAVERVSAVDKCSVEEARKQLLQMFRDGRVRLYWHPAPRRRKRGVLGMPMFFDIPPPGPHVHWPEVPITWDESSIFDDFEVVEGRARPRLSERRTLTVDEASLEEALKKSEFHHIRP